MPVGAITSQQVAILNNDSRPLVLDKIAPSRADPFADFKVVAPRSAQVAPNEQTEKIQFRPSRATESTQTVQLTTDVGAAASLQAMDLGGEREINKRQHAEDAASHRP